MPNVSMYEKFSVSAYQNLPDSLGNMQRSITPFDMAAAYDYITQSKLDDKNFKKMNMYDARNIKRKNILKRKTASVDSQRMMTFGCLQNQSKPILVREKSPKKRQRWCESEEQVDKPILAITQRTEDPEHTQ